MFAFTDKHLVDRTATIYDAVNCANRTGLTMNSGDHPWLVVNTSNPNVMYNNLPNVNGILWFAGQPSGYEEQQEWEPINIDWTDEAGTRYGGELDLISGVLTSKWRTIVFDGVNTKATNCRIVQSGSRSTNLIGYYVVDLFDTENNVYNRTASQKMCSLFPWLRYNDRYTAVPGEIYFATTAGQVIWCDPTFTTLEQFNNYLAEQYAAGTPVTISYIRAEQYYTDYQLDPIPLRTLLDRNCVWSNANGETEVEYAFTDRLAKRRMLMQMPQGGLLPREYQQVEYIETDGYAFIDSGVYGNQDSGVLYDIQLVNVGDYHIFGSRTNASSNAFYLTIRGGTYFASSYDGSGNQDFTSDGTVAGTKILADLNRHTIIQQKNNRYFDGTSNFAIGTYTEFTTPSTLTLFRINPSTPQQKLAEMRIYSCIIYSNGTAVREFVPCYRKQDNVIGMYDLINGSFYTNSNTQGSFIKGNNV